jgi:hypothetical protein
VYSRDIPIPEGGLFCRFPSQNIVRLEIGLLSTLHVTTLVREISEMRLVEASAMVGSAMLSA